MLQNLSELSADRLCMASSDEHFTVCRMLTGTMQMLRWQHAVSTAVGQHAHEQGRHTKLRTWARSSSAAR